MLAGRRVRSHHTGRGAVESVDCLRVLRARRLKGMVRECRVCFKLGRLTFIKHGRSHNLKSGLPYLRYA